jgi:2-methylisocitrate lyase-like PEP mutase family enzyme
VNLFINARTDVYLAKLVAPEGAAAETIRRGRACKAAGASGLFAPFVIKPDEITEIAQGVDMPLNVISWAGVPRAGELRRLGARRLSAGTEIGRAAFNAARLAAEALLREGDSDDLAARAGERINFNALFGA